MVLGARWRTLVTIVLIALFFVPVFRDGDGVPLSSYPMYATPRSSTVEFVVVVAVDEVGSETVVPSTVSAGTTDPLIAESYLRREIGAGRGPEVCAAIAERSGRGRPATYEIRLESHRVIDRAVGAPSLLDREVVATCLPSER